MLYRYWGLDSLYIGFLNEDFPGLITELFDLRLFDDFTA